MAANTNSDSSALTARLSKTRPSSLRVILTDGSEKEVAIPGKRKKWSQVAKVLESYSWLRCECLDPKGRALDIVENEDLEEFEEEGSTARDLKPLLALMLKAQDIALRRNAEQSKQVIEMNLKLAEVLMKRLTSLEASFASNLRMAQRAAGANGEESEGMMSTALIEALAPQLMLKLLPQLGALPPGTPPIVDGATPEV